MPWLVWLIAGVVIVAVSTALGRRLRIAGPLILVTVGLLASVFLPPFSVPPEIILVGILPPLLYAAAVRLPAVEFRRDARPISGLSVLLVVLSALALGTLFYAAIPELDFALAVALGAILSPTDAVATSIAKGLGLSPRVITMLEGESLLNDATALVLLRSAIAASAAGFSFWGTVGSFAWGVVIAVAVGVVVGILHLRVRRWIADPVAGAAIGFIIPFVAYLPTEHLGGSGLVAAVAAGITTGQGAARAFTPEVRVSDQVNWRTIELLLEGAVFLVMGLELRDIVSATIAEHDGLGRAVLLAVAALAIVLAVRAVYVSILVSVQGRRARGRRRERLEAIGSHLDQLDPADLGRRRPGDPARAARRLARMRATIRRSLNDLDYYRSSPLGWKHGTIIVWAGMRGVVTLAAAQTLPTDTPARELLILVAFLVALVSLLGQGLSLPWLIRLLRLPPAVDSADAASERERLDDHLQTAALACIQAPGLVDPHGEPYPREMLARLTARLEAAPVESDEMSSAAIVHLRIAMIEAMRERLVTLSHDGTYSSATLRRALAQVDADQLSLHLRREQD